MLNKIKVMILTIIMILSSSLNIYAINRNNFIVVYDDYITENEKALFKDFEGEITYIESNNVKLEDIDEVENIIYFSRKHNDFKKYINKRIYIINFSNFTKDLFVPNIIKYKSKDYKYNGNYSFYKVPKEKVDSIVDISSEEGTYSYMFKYKNAYVQTVLNINEKIEYIITKDLINEFLNIYNLKNKEYIFFENDSNIANEEIIKNLFFDSIDEEYIIFNDLNDTAKLRHEAILQQNKLFIETNEENLQKIDYIKSMGFEEGSLESNDKVNVTYENGVYILKAREEMKEYTKLEKITNKFSILIFIVIVIFIIILLKNRKKQWKKLFKE